MKSIKKSPTNDQKEKVLSMTKNIIALKFTRSRFSVNSLTYKEINKEIKKSEKELTAYRKKVGLPIK